MSFAKVGIVGTIMMIVIAAMVYLGNQLKNDRITILQLTTENKTQRDALAKADETILKLKSSSEITISTLDKVDKKVVVTKQKREARLVAVADKVDLILADTLAVSPDKQKEISKTYVASLWQEYCFATNVAQTCVAQNAPQPSSLIPLSEPPAPVVGLLTPSANEISQYEESVTC